MRLIPDLKAFHNDRFTFAIDCRKSFCPRECLTCLDGISCVRAICLLSSRLISRQTYTRGTRGWGRELVWRDNHKWRVSFNLPKNNSSDLWCMRYTIYFAHPSATSSKTMPHIIPLELTFVVYNTLFDWIDLLTRANRVVDSSSRLKDYDQRVDIDVETRSPQRSVYFVSELNEVLKLK